MPTFVHRSEIPVPPGDVYDWHARPGAFDRLSPPWETARQIEPLESLEEGARAVLEVGPFRQRWVAEHRDIRPGESFRDVCVSGPFPHWDHVHSMHPGSAGGTRLEDHIEFRMPFGPLGALGEGILRGKLDRMFAYRHRVTREDLLARASWPAEWRDHPRRVAITGASGLVGSALSTVLSVCGHQAVPIVRRPTPGGILWDPRAGSIDAEALEGIDAVVHLAGESIAGGRWTDEKKRRIEESRVLGTTLLARTLAGLQRPPRVLVSASAVGYYGDRGDERIDESSPRGEGFLAETCEPWERSADPARDAGIRVVHPRIGVVLAQRGGALAQMLPPFRFGVGGPLGSGQQWMSWIALDDLVYVLLHALAHDRIEGPVNATAPQPVRNADFTRVLGRVLRRPAFLPVPAFALRLLFGEMADHLLLTGQQVWPDRLTEDGFRFAHPDLEGALRHLLGRT